ncbi:MAG: carboxypeptidase-like regulatory domain-containing protein [Gemmatimonadaceae bacterium]
MLKTGFTRQISNWIALSALAAKRRFFQATIATALVCCAERANAQELRVTVMMSNGTTPASGVVAVLLHPTRDDSIMARAVSSERGRFVLKTSPTTGARLRLLRIGFEPMYVGDFTLTAGEVRDVSVTLADVRIRLASVDVKAASRCELRPDGARLVAQLFQQARTALIASTTPLVGNASATQFSSYRRRQDRRGLLLSPIQRTTQSSATVRPFASASVDSLTKFGYVVSDGMELSGGGTYYAPDANVLLSDAFLAHHCLQLVQGKDSLGGSIGIGFRPAGDRKNLVDVRGTLWLDRVTSELQFLEFTYEGLPDYLVDAGLGGRVEYAQLSNGSWFVNNWSIRMPVLSAANVARIGAFARAAGSDRVIASGQLIEGGQVQSIRVDDQVLYLNTDAARAGQTQQEVDAERASIAAALKSLEGSPAGTVVRVDSSTTPSSCTEKLSPQRPGGVRGRVLDENRRGVEDQDVKAEWKEDFELSSGAGLRWRNSALRTLSVEDGAYRICGLPADRSVGVSVLIRDNFWTRPATVRLSEDAPIATLDLPIARSAVKAVAQSSNERSDAASANNRTADASRLAELRITNVAGQPVPYAVVALPDGITRIADSLGMVQFGNGGKDTVQTVVKRMRFESYDGAIVRHSAAEAFTVALLPSSRAFASVVTPVRSPLEASGFYARMMEGQRGGNVGEFMAPEKLDARNATVSQHLSSSRYAKVERVGALPVVRGRAGCVMTFIVDGRRIENLYEGKSKDRGNMDTVDDLVKGADVVAIEVYPGRANVPVSLQQLSGGGSCGLVVVWTGAR